MQLLLFYDASSIIQWRSFYYSMMQLMLFYDAAYIILWWSIYSSLTQLLSSLKVLLFLSDETSTLYIGDKFSQTIPLILLIFQQSKFPPPPPWTQNLELLVSHTASLCFSFLGPFELICWYSPVYTLQLCVLKAASLKDSATRVLTSGFFNESSSSGPQCVH
jgi:hypothetical protein